jgi:superfamily II DNA or RNA helicase
MDAIAQLPTTFRLTPRPYQHEAVAALLAATARGVQRPLLVLPTGTGKTIVFALLVLRRRGRSLILAHRDELIQQAVDKLHLVDPTLPLGVVQAACDEHTAPTVVASVQTLSRRTRLSRLVPDFQTIVIDEAHHAPAPTYRRILEYCRAWHPDGPLVVGVTATPKRGDHHSLRQVFERIVYQKTLLEMMQVGYLVDLRAFQVLLQADFDALRTQQGDFVEAELEHLLLVANAPAAGARGVPGPCRGPESPALYPDGGPGLCHGRNLPGRRYPRRGVGWDDATRDPPGHPPAAAHGRDARGRQLCGAHRRL